jgi:hypothetical protein
MISEQVNFIAIPRTATNSINELIYGERNAHHRSIRLTKDDRFSFAVIRNPLQRLMSWWKYHSNTIYDPTGEIYGLSFRDWVHNGMQHHWTDGFCEYCGISSPLNQWEFVCDEYGNIMVDRLLNFDNLQQDFDIALQPYLLSTKLPHVNMSNPNKTVSLSATTTNIIFEAFKNDLMIYNNLQPR